MRTPQQRQRIRLAVAAGVLLLLFLIFPPFLAFAELAARELRYLWWLILLFALGGWFIWLSNKKIP